jgi:Zn-dependent M28 family amino/carboxypeptidase
MKRRNCTLVFIAFDGEEFGFCGSKYHVDHPAFPLHRTAAMINLDQIGRMKAGKVMIIGNVIRKPMSDAIGAAAALSGDLKARSVPFVQRSGWSDQAAFARRGVPTLFFYAGATRDYHRMTDTADRVNAAGGASIAALAFDTLRALDLCFGP